jgi:hypothetical protein
VYHPLIQFNSQIQKLRGAVHKAILEITVLDSISETNSYSDNKIYSQFVSASGNEGYSIGSDKTTIGNKTTYKFLITEYVKQWFISTESRRISLYASNEAISADKFVICGANWFETNYRPKITVTFSKSQ